MLFTTVFQQLGLISERCLQLVALADLVLKSPCVLGEFGFATVLREGYVDGHLQVPWNHWLGDVTGWLGQPGDARQVCG